MLTEIEKLDLELIFLNELEDYSEVTFGIATITSIVSTLMTLIMSSSVIEDAKKDSILTKKINGILKTPNKYEVRILDEKMINAFAMNTNTIYVTKGLIKAFSDKPRIIEAALLHETGHVYNKDVVKQILADFPGRVFFRVILIDIYRQRTEELGLAVILYMLSKIGSSTVSQHHEFRADSVAVKYGYGKELVEFFKKLEGRKRKPKSLFAKLAMKGLGVIDRLFSTHPSAKRRIEKILNNKEFEKLKDKVKTEPAYVMKRIKSMVMGD